MDLDTGHKSRRQLLSAIIIMMIVLLMTMLMTCCSSSVAFVNPAAVRGGGFIVARRKNAMREIFIKRTVSSVGVLIMRSSTSSSSDIFSSSSAASDCKAESSHDEPAAAAAAVAALPPVPPLLYRSQGLFAVQKPLNWTSNNVVSYIRGILERDARHRGAKPAKVTSRRQGAKSNIVRVGHGGTLDPLATGVLVIGVGQGTKQLQSYLSGSKCYIASVELGFETTTLDMEGNVTKTVPCDHVTWQMIKNVLPKFQGSISQIPPIFSAIRKNGKKLYKAARQGVSADDLDIEPRVVEIHRIELLHKPLPHDGVSNNDDDDDEANIILLDSPTNKFDIEVECGGGTYIRSLVRDIGYALDTVATTTRLKRTKQGTFLLSDCLEQHDWTADNIFDAIDRMNERRAEEKVAVEMEA